MSLFQDSEKTQFRSTFEMATEKKESSIFARHCGVAVILLALGAIGLLQVDIGDNNRNDNRQPVDSSSLILPISNG